MSTAITAEDLEARLAGLRPIGLNERGTNRLAWTAEDAAAGAWFGAQALAAGLRVERDAAGNRWALPAEGDGPWWAVGSHTDSVRDGGAYDGALGVAAAFAVAAQLPGRVAVVSFQDEEGARFNTPTFGSRALTGVLDVDDVLGRVDDDGIALAEAMAADGVPPEKLVMAPLALQRLRGFVELHIDQSTELAAAGVPAGVVSALAARLRVRVTLRGATDHAGTTPPEDRRDALLAAARLIVASDDLRAAERAPLRTTAGRILVQPNALTAIASEVTTWLDARADAPATLDRWLAALRDEATRLADATGVEIALAVESRSDGAVFDAGLRARLAAAGGFGEGDPATPSDSAGVGGSATPSDSAGVGGSAPAEILCWAGHDAGILAPHVPSAMVLVRNVTGVSHSPAEHVELEDAAVGATMILRLLEDLV